jgi:hypothetical protein
MSDKVPFRAAPVHELSLVFHAPQQVAQVRVVGRRMALDFMLAGHAGGGVRPRGRGRLHPVLGARGLGLDSGAHLKMKETAQVQGVNVINL